MRASGRIRSGAFFLSALCLSVSAAGAPDDPWEGGQWGAVIEWPHIAVSAANLPDGRILTWSGSERETWPTTEQTYSATWDPSNNIFEEIFHPTHNMFCAHLAMLEDGRVFVNGGRNQTNSPWTSIFDFRDDEWVQIENMPSGGRWYPTTIATAEGDIFTAIGTASLQRYPELWTVDDGWQIKNGIDFNPMVLDDYFSSGTHGESRWWPILHVAPNGQIFHSGPTPKMHYIDPTGNGSFEQVGAEFTAWYHKHGTSIMYAEGKILTAGGWIAGNNTTSTNQAFTIDLNQPTPVVAATQSMTHARKFHNGVVLPTGEVLVIGGNTSGQKFSDNGAILATEIWNPETGEWRLGASMVTPRNYHSIALLLKDGRVLAAGGGYCSGSTFCNGSSHKDGEVYSPSYLFDGSGNLAARPNIDAAPPRVSSGETFQVTASTGVDRFTMVKMSSTTHGMNTDVRFIEVDFATASPGIYDLSAHINPNVLTAGYWMLFALDANGVPSEAHIVQANTSGMPWMNALPQQSSQQGEPVSVQVVAGDADDDALSYSAVNLPEGVTIDAATGLISGAATNNGTYNVTVTVTDNDEGSRSKSFEWLVFGEGLGGIRRDWWTGISGTAVANLTGNANYPASPTGTDIIAQFETPTNILDNYGTRVHGYLVPTTSGDYTFWIATDDGGELWLSTDDNPANRQLIASVPGWASPRQWNKFPEQQSAVITLEAGQSYYIEALMKEGGGGDNLAVAWQGPGVPGPAVIPGAYLSTAPVTTAGAPEDAQLNGAIVAGVTDTWQTVTLPTTYSDAVIIATPRLAPGGVPVVTRVRNVGPDSFELRVQNPGDLTATGPVDVHYVAVEAGTYSGNGVQFEAGVRTIANADHDASWTPEPHGYVQTYTNPAVLGQVMTANDDRFSVFWASDGSQQNPPNASSVAMGLHVAEDPQITRSAEQIGYLIMEAGSGDIAGLEYAAALGADIVEGVDNAPPYNYATPIDATVAVLSAAAMDGGNGGWPVLYGANPVASGTIGIVYEEDQINDSERVHITEQVAYLALGVAGQVPLTVDAIDPSPVVVSGSAAFEVMANGNGPLLYNWNFGDGSPETGFLSQSQVQHNYTTPGRYVVTVTVLDPATNEELTQTFVQLIHAPLTSTMAQASGSIAVIDALNQTWVVNPDNDTVAVIDTATNTLTAEVAVGDQPVALALAPDNFVWVVNRRDASVSRIDPAAQSVIATYALPHASQPYGIVIHEMLGVGYVALEGTSQIARIDLASGNVTDTTFVGGTPRHLSVDPATDQLLVSMFVTPLLPNEATAAPVVESGGVQYGGQVLAMDAVSMQQTGVAVLQHSDRNVSEHSGPGVPNYLGPAVVSPDGTGAWVPSKQDNILAGALRGGQGMTFDQTVRAVTSKIDLVTGAEAFWARIDHDNASVASSAAFGPYGVYLFTTLEGNREVVVSDAYTATELMRFDAGRAPQGVALSADGTRLYVDNFMDRTVSVYDIASLTGSNELDITPLADVTTVQSETLAPNILNGKQLFYDSRDPRLALDSYMSCASCHNNGGQDGRVWDFTGLGEGLRNTITLEGRAAVVHGFLHWSANFDEVQDFEAQIRDFAGGTGLMSDADYFTGTRSQPLGDPKAGLSADLDDMAAYLASLDTFSDSPYRNADGTLSSDGEAGMLLFTDKGCASCHAPPSFTDSNNGNLNDVGTLKPSSGQRLGGPLTGIDTPTLISLWNTAPYLHDGSAVDVSEAIEAHQGISLTASEVFQLSSYLLELDGVTAQLSPDDPDGCTDCLDFSQLTIASYSNQDIVGTYAITEGGSAIEMTDNTWKRTLETFDVTPTTVIEFEFRSTQQGEIHGIGLDEDNNLSSDRIFRVHGTQNWGIGGFNGYSGSDYVSMQIPVGQYYTGTGMTLVVVNDNDAGSGNTSAFRNVRIVQDGDLAPMITSPGTQLSDIGAPVSLQIAASDLNNDPLTFAATGLPPGLSMSTSGLVTGTPTQLGDFNVSVSVSDGAGGSDTADFVWTIREADDCSDCIDLSAIGLVSYSNQDIVGTQTLLDGGTAVRLENNTWKRSTSTFTITPNTVIEFEFSSTNQGEIHAIGFDADNTHASSSLMRVYGTQNYGNGTYDNYPGSGTVVYQIPIGQYYTGSSMYLVLINDHDAGSGNNSTFGRIRLFEQ
ncbi:MAG: putative Ig domain-containing protein [Pseudomonadota bacterium]